MSEKHNIRIISAVRDTLKELGKDHTTLDAMKIIDAFETSPYGSTVYLLRELLDAVKAQAKWEDDQMQGWQDDLADLMNDVGVSGPDCYHHQCMDTGSSGKQHD